LRKPIAVASSGRIVDYVSATRLSRCDRCEATWEPQFESGFHFRDDGVAIERGRGIFVEDRQAELTEGLVQLIQANSSKDDYIFSFAQRGSAFYFLAERRNPTRFLWWRSVGSVAKERDAVMTMIANRRASSSLSRMSPPTRRSRISSADNYDPLEQ